MNLVRTVAAFFKTFSGITSSTEELVIGTEIAQARQAQKLHERAQIGKDSPLSDLRYSNAECRLWRWLSSPIDSSIESIVAIFSGSEEADRTLMRDSLSMDDFYTLLTFAHRCALSTLRNGNASRIERAFMALAMIDLERIDWRDIVVASGLLVYAGEKAGAPVPTILKRSMQLAEPKTAQALLQRRTASINLATECGYQEVTTPEGVALFHSRYENFSPAADLIRLAFKCAVALESNGYEISDLEVATDLPKVWLGSPEDVVIGKLSGCVSIHGTLAFDPAPDSSGQSILVFVAEAASESDAAELADAVKNAAASWHTKIGIAVHGLCAVIIQRSVLADTPALEDARSLERLRNVFERLLDQSQTSLTLDR
ncbi:hypothetical protein [Pontixanthobacter sp. CEM42]|uniref:hypothetical protein n=1 Tax=Pontixanthobacter sp. CEM42 TaxID=2792077 RepID=UPI001AE04084|nr:hypothetical protein [Pontixanthobacter sp. CEM42]